MRSKYLQRKLEVDDFFLSLDFLDVVRLKRCQPRKNSDAIPLHYSCSNIRTHVDSRKLSRSKYLHPTIHVNSMTALLGQNILHVVTQQSVKTRRKGVGFHTVVSSLPPRVM